MDLEIISQGSFSVNNGKEIFALEVKALNAWLDPPYDGLWDTPYVSVRTGYTSSEKILGGSSWGQKPDLKARHRDRCCQREPVTSRMMWSMLAAHWAGWSAITLTYIPAGKRILTADVAFLRELWQSHIRRYMQLMLGTCQCLAECPHLHHSEETLVSQDFFLFGIFPHKKWISD